jgi:tRNA (guanine-N7-)-methyltransferase
MTDPDDATRPNRGIRSFVVRAGRMGPGQARALAGLGPRFVLPYVPELADFAASFGREAPRVLEIGFGMGGATAAIAQALPAIDFIGVEVHPPGVGALLKRIGELELTNLRLIQHDALEVLQHMIAPASLSGVQVFFPDPWHKKRHHKRRLIQPEFVALLVSRLAPTVRAADARGAVRGSGPAQHCRGLRAAPGVPAADEVRGPRVEARPRRVGPDLRQVGGRLGSRPRPRRRAAGRVRKGARRRRLTPPTGSSPATRSAAR